MPSSETPTGGTGPESQEPREGASGSDVPHLQDTLRTEGEKLLQQEVQSTPNAPGAPQQISTIKAEQEPPISISHAELRNILNRTTASMRVGTGESEDHEFFAYCRQNVQVNSTYFRARDACVDTQSKWANELPDQITRLRFTQFMQGMRNSFAPFERVLLSFKQHGSEPLRLRYERLFDAIEREAEALFASKDFPPLSATTSEKTKPTRLPRSTFLAKFDAGLSQMRHKIEESWIALPNLHDQVRPVFSSLLDGLMACEQELPFDIEAWEDLTAHKKRVEETIDRYRSQFPDDWEHLADKVGNYYLEKLDNAMQELRRDYALRGTPQQTEVSPPKPTRMSKQEFKKIVTAAELNHPPTIVFKLDPTDLKRYKAANRRLEDEFAVAFRAVPEDIHEFATVQQYMERRRRAFQAHIDLILHLHEYENTQILRSSENGALVEIEHLVRERYALKGMPEQTEAELTAPFTSEELWKLCEPAIDDLKYVMQAHGVTADAMGKLEREIHESASQSFRNLRQLVVDSAGSTTTMQGALDLLQAMYGVSLQYFDTLKSLPDEEARDAIGFAHIMFGLTLARGTVRLLERERTGEKPTRISREEFCAARQLSFKAYPPQAHMDLLETVEGEEFQSALRTYDKKEEDMRSSLSPTIDGESAIVAFRGQCRNLFDQTVNERLSKMDDLDTVRAVRRSYEAGWDAFLSMVHANYELRKESAPRLLQTVPKEKVLAIIDRINRNASPAAQKGMGRMETIIQENPDIQVEQRRKYRDTVNQIQAETEEVRRRLPEGLTREDCTSLVQQLIAYQQRIRAVSGGFTGELAQVMQVIAAKYDSDTLLREILQLFTPVTEQPKRTEISHDELIRCIGTVNIDRFVQTWGPKGNKKLSHGQGRTARAAVDAFERGLRRCLQGLPNPIMQRSDIAEFRRRMQEEQRTLNHAIAQLPSPPRDALNTLVSGLFVFGTWLSKEFELASDQEDTVTEVLTVRVIPKRALAAIYRGVLAAHTLSDDDQQALFTALQARQGAPCHAAFQTFVRAQQALLTTPQSDLPAKLREAFKPLSDALLNFQDQELAKRVCATYEDAFNALEREIASLFHIEETAADALPPKP